MHKETLGKSCDKMFKIYFAILQQKIIFPLTYVTSVVSHYNTPTTLVISLYINDKNMELYIYLEFVQ